jgi:hypothetical protein
MRLVFSGAEKFCPKGKGRDEVFPFWCYCFGRMGTARAKKERLGQSGAIVIDQVTEFPEAISKVLKRTVLKRT